MSMNIYGYVSKKGRTKISDFESATLHPYKNCALGEHNSFGLVLETEANARIAELTAHLETVRKSYDDCYSENEKLTAELTCMRSALKKIQRLNNWDDKTAAGLKISETYGIARNALRADS